MLTYVRSLLGPIFFTVVLVNFIALLHYYLFRGFTRTTAHRGARRMVAWSFGVLAALLVAGPVGERLAPSVVTLAAARISYVWLGVAFYLFCALALFDVAHRAVRARDWLRHRRAAKAAARNRAEEAPGAAPADDARISRRAFLGRSASYGAFAVAMPTATYGIWRAFAPAEISEISVPLPRMPRALSGLTIVQLSDIHVGPWLERGFMRDLVARANALKPDLVAITGDLVDGRVADLRAEVAPLMDLRSRFGTYFITGNHEYYSGADAWCDELRRMGLKVLRNERTTIGDAGASFDLVGVDDWSAAGRGFTGGYNLDAALDGRDPERAAVLLAHQPRGFDDATDRGIGLQLSGHTHGGQIWPWTYVVRLAYAYSSGLYHNDAGFIYVHRGCGFWGPPLRVAAPPEIARIALV